jgi:hypothetical protein
MPLKDNEARLEWQRQYYLDHKEERLAYAAENAEHYKALRVRSYHKDIARAMWHSAKSRAKRKGLTFTITQNDITVPDVCPLLLIPIAASTEARAPGSPSLDRKDATKGYVPGNVWVISYRANRIKNDATLAEFIMMADNLKFLLGGS